MDILEKLIAILTARNTIIAFSALALSSIALLILPPLLPGQKEFFTSFGEFVTPVFLLSASVLIMVAVAGVVDRRRAAQKISSELKKRAVVISHLPLEALEIFALYMQPNKRFVAFVLDAQEEVVKMLSRQKMLVEVPGGLVSFHNGPQQMPWRYTIQPWVWECLEAYPHLHKDINKKPRYAEEI